MPEKEEKREIKPPISDLDPLMILPIAAAIHVAATAGEVLNALRPIAKQFKRIINFRD